MIVTLLLINALINLVGGALWLANPAFAEVVASLSYGDLIRSTYGIAALAMAASQGLAGVLTLRNKAGQRLLWFTGIWTLLVELAGVSLRLISSVDSSMQVITHAFGLSTGILTLIYANITRSGTGRVRSLSKTMGDAPPSLLAEAPTAAAQHPTGWVRQVLRFEGQRTLRSPLSLLGGVFTACFSLWFCALLIKNASTLHALLSPERGPDQMGMMGPLNALVDMMLGMLDHSVVTLFNNEPPLLGLAHMLLILATPSLAILICSDQLADDLGRKHVRFLLPRFGRAALFVARCLGTWLRWCIIAAPSSALIIITALAADPTPMTTAHVFMGAQLWVTTLIYGLPFAGLMAAINTVSTNASLSAMMGFAYWFAVTLVAGIGATIHSSLEGLSYLFPTAFKFALLTTEPLPLLGWHVALIMHAIFFAAIGLIRFRQRDV